MKRTQIEDEQVGVDVDVEMMDVDGEEKAEREEHEEEPNEEEEVEENDGEDADESPFLDSFYGISSPNVAERATASKVLLHYSLLGPEANTKDAAYAFRRLLNGLCSGRAAARQGNASTLASFLKVAFTLGKMGEIREASGNTDDTELSDLAYVRHRLRTATEIGDTQGRRKGSEERDYRFGRLFGINGIVRSGILLPLKNSTLELNDIIEVASSLTCDLVDLYGYKKWIREPAAHAICTMLNSFYSLCPNNKDAQKIVEHLVENVVIPNLLMKGDVQAEEKSTLVETYSAEQIGIALNIQSQAHLHSKDLPDPLNEAVLSKDKLPLVSLALSETSTVTQPRTHLVWDTFLNYISTSSADKKAKVDFRNVRSDCPIGTDSVDDLLGAVVKHVVVERLLGMKISDDEQSSGNNKTTHERRALALCIVRNLASVEYMSSISGRTRIILEPSMLEHVVFDPVLVRRLFLDVICAGKGGKKNQSSHLLKPLAVQVLLQISETLRSMEKSKETMNRRLAIVKALLTCDPRFDSGSKTTIVESLLGFDNEIADGESLTLLWTPYAKFLEDRILGSDLSPGQEDDRSSYGKIGYIDLLFHLGKILHKTELKNESGLSDDASVLSKRIVGLLMAIAFFDCSEIKSEATPGKKKKKKHSITGKLNTVIEVASRVKDSKLTEKSGRCPFELRSIASARFFSLASDIVGSLAHSSIPDKDKRILQVLTDLNEMQSQLEQAGAKRHSSIDDADDAMDTDEDEDPVKIVKKARDVAESLEKSNDEKGSRARKRWAYGCAILSSTLYLHLLNCGNPDVETDRNDLDADEEEDSEEVLSFLNDLAHVSALYQKKADVNGDNPLTALAELCANVLSSFISSPSQSHGASPTLLREAVKIAWAGGLTLTACESDDSLLDSHVVNILLNAIGAVDGSEIEDDDSSDGGGDDSIEGDGDGEDSDREDKPQTGVFTADALGKDLEIRDEEMNDANQSNDNELDEDGKKDDSSSSEADVEVDETKLRSMLEEDSDADIDKDELEHHEGADAALAKLIKAKHDARKAGQIARERVELTRQMRCVILLETLVVGKPDNWGSLLRVDLVLQMIHPILQYRKDLVRSLQKTLKKGTESGTSEKRAMAERLMSLLKGKILKIKVAGHKWSNSANISDISQNFASMVVQLAKKNVDKNHQSLCSSSLIFMLRNIEDENLKQDQALIFGDAVMEWATKRTSQLDSSFFEGLVHQYPVMAQICLTDALVKSSLEARSSFLKSESFRLLSLLYNPKLNSNETKSEKNALSVLQKEADKIFRSVVAAIEDDDMKKSKRMKETLKALDNILRFLKTFPQSSEPLTEATDLLVHKLKNLKGSSESNAVVSLSEKLLKSLNEMKNAERNVETKAPADVEDHVEQSENEGDNGDNTAASEHKKSKKHKKKKSKKKKRK